MYVQTNIQICAQQSLVVPDPNSGFRMAKTLGGTVSRSGLTMDPRWAEEGAMLALRADSVPLDPERVPNPLLVFDGHGTSPDLIREWNRDLYLRAVEAWTQWRKEGRCAIPRVETEEEWAAKRNTRDLEGAALTAGEAVNGLLMRKGAPGPAILNIEEDLEEKEGSELRWDWDISIPGVGYAYAFGASAETPPTRWQFCRDHKVWEFCDDEGWRYRNEFRVMLAGERYNDTLHMKWRDGPEATLYSLDGIEWLSREEMNERLGATAWW